VFESSDPSVKVINATDSRFFWIALYSQPLLWVGLAFVAIFSFEFIWLTLVGMCGYCCSLEEFDVEGGMRLMWMQLLR
jgi:ABC-type dipeptide/oligopeptide/nickel transport system permease component